MSIVPFKNQLINRLQERRTLLSNQLLDLEKKINSSTDPSLIVTLDRQAVRLRGKLSECKALILYLLKYQPEVLNE